MPNYGEIFYAQEQKNKELGGLLPEAITVERAKSQEYNRCMRHLQQENERLRMELSPTARNNYPAQFMRTAPV
jgi:hypothetical protein